MREQRLFVEFVGARIVEIDGRFVGELVGDDKVFAGLLVVSRDRHRVAVTRVNGQRHFKVEGARVAVEDVRLEIVDEIAGVLDFRFRQDFAVARIEQVDREIADVLVERLAFSGPQVHFRVAGDKVRIDLADDDILGVKRQVDDGRAGANFEAAERFSAYADGAPAFKRIVKRFERLVRKERLVEPRLGAAGRATFAATAEAAGPHLVRQDENLALFQGASCDEAHPVAGRGGPVQRLGAIDLGDISRSDDPLRGIARVGANGHNEVAFRRHRDTRHILDAGNRFHVELLRIRGASPGQYRGQRDSKQASRQRKPLILLYEVGKTAGAMLRRLAGSRKGIHTRVAVLENPASIGLIVCVPGATIGSQ